MKKPKYILLLLLVTPLVSCTFVDFENAGRETMSEEFVDSLRVESQRLRDEGRSLREHSELMKALDVQSEALKMSQLIEDTMAMVQDYNQLGTTFRRLSRYEQALHNHFQAISLAEAYHEDTSHIAIKNTVVSCNGIGNVYLSLGNYDQAEKYFRLALKGETKVESDLGMAINFANLGSIMQQRNNLDSALWYYEQSMQKNLLLESNVGISLCHVNLGEVYETRGDLERAEQELRQAVDVIRQNPDRWHAAESLMALSRFLYRQHRFREAQPYADEALQIARDVNSYEQLHEAYELKAMLCEAKGDMRSAVENYRISHVWSDSISKRPEIANLQNLCIDYEVKLNRQQMEELSQAYETNVRMQHYISRSSLVISLILVVTLLVMIYALRVRKEKLSALARLDTMRNTFFRNLTHEFRTPLTVIMGLAEQMKNEEMQPEQRAHLLTSINQQGKSLLNLVNQLLSLSKMMAGYEQCEWRHGNVVAFLRTAFSGYADFARMRNIELKFEAKSDVIEMDFVPDYYQKIVNNLMGNSFKHTSSGGCITLSVCERQNHLSVYVTDTGEGIHEEDLPHIFEVFYQGRDAVRQCSTGLGLPFVQQMVRQMGGIITAENRLPHGTSIHILTSMVCNQEGVTDIKPWVLADSIVDMAKNRDSALFAEETQEETSLPLVMIVEDNPDISDYIALLLHSRYRVVKASDGYAALHLLSQQLPDIILTDLMMPGMDGYELCQAIRQSAVMSDVPIVIISARAEEDDRSRGLEYGADSYLIKPFNPAELQELITLLLTRRVERRQHVRHLLTSSAEAAGDAEEDTKFFKALYDTVHDQMLSSRNLQPDHIASLLHMSRMALSRQVFDLAGCPLQAFILQVRLAHACHLLRETTLSVSEIALTCGFDDLTYFNRVFRQNFETTPAQYRQQAHLHTADTIAQTEA